MLHTLAHPKKLGCHPDRQGVTGKLAALLTPRKDNRIYKTVFINAYKARVLIDPGADYSYMSETWVRKNDIPTVRRERPITMELGDESNKQERLLYDTEPLSLNIEGILNIQKFTIMNIHKVDAIIGVDWHKEINPDINWVTESITRRRPARKIAGKRHKDHTVEEGPTQRSLYRLSSKDMDKTLSKRQAGDMVYLVSSGPKNPDKGWKQPEPGALPPEYQDFADVFQDQKELETLPPHQPWDHKIELVEGANLEDRLPVKIRPMTREEREELKEHLKLNLKRQFMRKSKSPFTSSILFVPKKNGKKRLCVDYRRLNDATIKNRYPLPNIDEMMQQLQGAKWFTKFDIQEGFHRIRIAEGHEWKTAFRTSEGLFEYTVMPFGLTNAPATFQAVINAALNEYLGVFAFAYLDDVLVYTNGTLEEHEQHVKKVLHKLREYKLFIALEKSEFHTIRTEYLGFIISRDKIEADPKKIAAIQDWGTPTSVKEVQAFLGFANFYRKFIKSYSKIASPLSDLTKKDLKFAWETPHEEAFQELKKRFTTAPFLWIFDPEKPAKVETDASDGALGAVLYTQNNEEKWVVSEYYSRKFSPAERNYDIHDKELLGIVDTFRHWRAQLMGTKHTVQVFTDHHNLTRFMTTKELEPRQIRWYQKLASYDFTIAHLKGSLNNAADALSRRADYIEAKQKPKATLLKKGTDGLVRLEKATLSKLTSYETSGGWKDILEETRRKEITALDRQEQLAYERAQQTNTTYVPEKWRQDFLRILHESKEYGHPGVGTMINKVSRHYSMAHMKKAIEEVVGNCDKCQRNKIKRHKPYGLLQPHGAPKRPWSEVTMDFIVKLPKSIEPGTKQECDAILVIVERFTKYTKFIPLSETITAPELAYIVIKSIMSDFGVPDKFITDRDKLFTAKFWQTLWSRLGTKLNLSTAGHPQTDGQTERLNQMIEQYLRMYVNEEQNDWVEYLPMAQFAHNSAKSSTTGFSPFFANYGYEPTMGEPVPEPISLSEDARIKAERIAKIHEQMRQNIDLAADRMKVQADKKRISGPTFGEGGKAYLSRKNLRTKKPSNKLDGLRTGPFEVKRRTGPVNYELKLPKSMKRLHPVFHVNLLEPAPPDIQVMEELELEPEEEFEVESIQGLQKFGRQWKYLVKWKDYDTEENTWEPPKHLQKQAVRKLVEDFHKANPQLPDPREKRRAKMNLESRQN